jgi:hypothetical protein
VLQETTTHLKVDVYSPSGHVNTEEASRETITLDLPGTLVVRNIWLFKKELNKTQHQVLAHL